MNPTKQEKNKALVLEAYRPALSQPPVVGQSDL